MCETAEMSHLRRCLHSHLLHNDGSVKNCEILTAAPRLAIKEQQENRVKSCFRIKHAVQASKYIIAVRWLLVWFAACN